MVVLEVSPLQRIVLLCCTNERQVRTEIWSAHAEFFSLTLPPRPRPRCRGCKSRETNIFSSGPALTLFNVPQKLAIYET